MNIFPIKIKFTGGGSGGGWVVLTLALAVNLAFLYVAARVVATGVAHGLGL